MKLHHFGIIFMVLAVAIFLMLDIRTSSLKAIYEESLTLERCLSQAVDDGANALVQSQDLRKLILSKNDGVQTFYTSMYSALGIASDIVAQEKIRRYIPVIAITDSDGLYLFYQDEYQVSGVKTIAMRWSEKYPYAYEDEYFVYHFTLGDTVKIYDKKHQLISNDKQPYLELDFHDLQNQEGYHTFRNEHAEHFLFHKELFQQVKRDVITHIICDKLAFYSNRYNHIAYQYGIEYHFSLPTISQSELMRSVEQPGMIVLFQGYPLREQNHYYNRTEVAGAQIFKKNHYYIELKDWCKIYHKSNCLECIKRIDVDQSQMFFDIRDCVVEGAYACEVCCPEGVPVPESLSLHYEIIP